MKVIIAGGRDFSDRNFLFKKCDSLLINIKVTEIVSGGARGVDLLGEDYAMGCLYNWKRFPADWDKHGKSAGYIRNEEMAKYSDALIAFWDGKSKGTKHMIDLAKKHKLKVKVVKYDRN
jgi:hypothetical protein